MISIRLLLTAPRPLLTALYCSLLLLTPLPARAHCEWQIPDSESMKSREWNEKDASRSLP